MFSNPRDISQRPGNLLTYKLCAHKLWAMKNITLSIDEDLLKLGREYARTHNISFNGLVRKLIEQTVQKPNTRWLDDTFEYIDNQIDSSQGISWTRDELYRGDS